MLTFFPFVHDQEMNPVYCSIYGDMYSWRLGRIEYDDPDNIAIMVTADSIKRSAYNTALDKIMRNKIHIDEFFGHVDVHKTGNMKNLSDHEFRDFYVSYGEVKSVPSHLPNHLVQSCKAILEVTFTRRNKFQIDKVDCVRIEI